MARVTGPLMSMEASGTIGKTLTFANWVGRQYVRRWTRPSNPQTQDQMDQRNAFSVIGVGVSWANKCLQINSSTTKTDEAAYREKTPSGMRWNGYIQKVLTGSGAAGYKAAKLAWDALLAAWFDPQLQLRMLVGGLVGELSAGLLPHVAHWCAGDGIGQGDAVAQF